MIGYRCGPLGEVRSRGAGIHRGVFPWRVIRRGDGRAKALRRASKFRVIGGPQGRRRGGRCRTSRGQVGGVVGKHIGRRQKFDGSGNLTTLDGAGGKLDLAIPVGHGRRHLGALVALGKRTGKRHCCSKPITGEFVSMGGCLNINSLEQTSGVRFLTGGGMRRSTISAVCSNNTVLTADGMQDR